MHENIHSYRKENKQKKTLALAPLSRELLCLSGELGSLLLSHMLDPTVTVPLLCYH